jgi:hypothetical protein
MSRGLGSTQQKVLTALTDAASNPLSVYELAEYVYGRRALSPPGHSEREAIRRALLTLQRRGLVELGYGTAASVDNDNWTYTIRRHLVAWTVPA